MRVFGLMCARLTIGRRRKKSRKNRLTRQKSARKLGESKTDDAARRAGPGKTLAERGAAHY